MFSCFAWLIKPSLYSPGMILILFGAFQSRDCQQKHFMAWSWSVTGTWAEPWCSPLWSIGKGHLDINNFCCGMGRASPCSPRFEELLCSPGPDFLKVCLHKVAQQKQEDVKMTLPAYFTWLYQGSPLPGAEFSVAVLEFYCVSMPPRTFLLRNTKCISLVALYFTLHNFIFFRD